MTGNTYYGYILEFQRRLTKEREYITNLDAATGDGDHWINLQNGFQELKNQKDKLENLPLDELFKSIGMTLMSKVGGSSGVLYGSAYLEAAKVCSGKLNIDVNLLCAIFEAMTSAIMKRGNSIPGQKTMIDAIYPACQMYRKCLEEGLEEKLTLSLVKQAATDGAVNTKEMEAVKGRAYYQTNKGKGNIDPGAMTIAYQIETLVDYIINNCF